MSNGLLTILWSALISKILADLPLLREVSSLITFHVLRLDLDQSVCASWTYRGHNPCEHQPSRIPRRQYPNLHVNNQLSYEPDARFHPYLNEDHSDLSGLMLKC